MATDSTTSALPVVAQVGVAAGWHAPTAVSAPAVAHLMPTTWADDGRKSRPALCGERRMRWTAADHVERDLLPCDRCLAAAEQLPPIGATVQIAPTAPRAGHVVGRVSDPHVPSTVHDRARGRAAMRDLVELSEPARRYQRERWAELRARERAAALSPGLRVPDPASDPASDPAADVDDMQPYEPSPDPDPHRPLAYSTST